MSAADAVPPGTALLRPLRERWRRWWLARLPRSDTLELTQRNVYILPTRAGLMLAATLLVLLLASINYQLNLGYLLTFLLGGSAVVSTYVSHGTLRGLTLVLHPVAAHHAGTPAPVRITLHNARATPRYGIGLRWHQRTDRSHWIWCDVPAQGSAEVELVLAALPRGVHSLPAITAETRFPLGVFRVWTLWQPAAEVLVYPAPEPSPPPLPPAQPHGQAAMVRAQPAGGEWDSLRPYRRGDALKHIVWKKAARTDELVSRDLQQGQPAQLWLDLAHTPGATLEQRLSRLCAWVLAAEEQGLDYGLRVGGLEIPPARGAAQQHACLEVLARV
jgi:uncharacterized protein (DUF58 family)